MFDFLTISRALTDENRVRILMALRERELCVCQITGFLDLAPSTTSKHLSILRQAKLIRSRKKGKWVYYTQAKPEEAPEAVREAMGWAVKALKDSPTVQEDKTRIEEILKLEGAMHNHLEGMEPDNFHSLEIHSLAAADEDC